jgi:hypothetical protein
LLNWFTDPPAWKWRESIKSEFETFRENSSGINRFCGTIELEDNHKSTKNATCENTINPKSDCLDQELNTD